MNSVGQKAIDSRGVEVVVGDGRHELAADDVLAGAQSALRQVEMALIGGADMHHLHVGGLDQLVDGAGGTLGHGHSLHGSSATRVWVRHTDDNAAGRPHGVYVHTPDEARTDHRGSDPTDGRSRSDGYLSKVVQLSSIGVLDSLHRYQRTLD